MKFCVSHGLSRHAFPESIGFVFELSSRLLAQKAKNMAIWHHQALVVTSSQLTNFVGKLPEKNCLLSRDGNFRLSLCLDGLAFARASRGLPVPSLHNGPDIQNYIQKPLFKIL